MNLFHGLIGVATGILSGFGIGGGSLLMLYLTAVVGVDTRLAGGINLLYFMGCAPCALIGHIRNKRIEWKAALLCAAGGILTAVAASLLAGQMSTDLLRRLFGVLLLFVAVKEWRQAKNTKQ